MIALLKGYFKIQDRDDLRDIREKVTDKLLRLDRALEPTLPALLSLLDVPIEDTAWSKLDPPQRRQQTLDAVKRLLLREAREQPLLVIFEDLHWIDGETQALLAGLVDSIGSARLMLLVNYRPEYQHAWGSKTTYSQLRLDALPAASADELLEALLGDDPGLVPLKQLLVKRGNPFFLEETVRTLVETKALMGERGRYRLMQPVQALGVPATVHAVLAARIDRLPQEDKRLLQVAAVIGKDVPFALLQAIADLPDEALRRGLDHLQAAEFLYETRLFPDLEYTFKHALTHEVAYGSLLHERRRALHARIVEAMEAAYTDRLAEQVERLAHHAAKGELWDRAVTYLRQAGVRAFARSANREVAFFEQALPLLSRLPESREREELAVDLRFDLRNSLQMLGQFKEAIPFVREAERIARTLDDPRRLGLVSAYLSWYHWGMGHYADALGFARAVLSSAEALDDLPLRVVGLFYDGVVHHAAGDHRRATERLRAVGTALAGELAYQRLGLAGFPAALSRCFLSWALGEQGLFVDGIAEGREGIRIAEVVDHPYSLIQASWGLGHLYCTSGDFEQAVPLLERALTLVRERSVPILFHLTARPLGYARAMTGRVREGLTLLEGAQAVQQSIGARHLHALCVVQLGEVSALAGRHDDARRLAGKTLTIAREVSERGHEAYALRLLGELAAHGDAADIETAEGRYHEALTLADELGMRPLVAHCHLGLAKLYRRTGKRIESDEHFAAATTMYREMGMTYWLEKAEAEMREFG